eukprot:1135419-Amphidinium_carterae.1
MNTPTRTLGKEWLNWRQTLYFKNERTLRQAAFRHQHNDGVTKAAPKTCCNHDTCNKKLPTSIMFAKDANNPECSKYSAHTNYYVLYSKNKF